MPELEKQLVITALERNHWNQTRAADFLGISRNVLIYRMQKYRLGSYGNPTADAGGEATEKSDPTIATKKTEKDAAGKENL